MLTVPQAIYLLIIATGFLVGLINVKKQALLLPVVIILGLTLYSETLSRAAAYTASNNNFIFHFFNPVQGIAWGYFFYTHVQTKLKRWVVYLLSALILFGMLNSFLWQPLKTFPGNFIKFENLFLLFFAMKIFIEFLDKPSNENIFRNKVFIVCVGVLWFNLTSFIFFNLFNYCVSYGISIEPLRQVNYISNYIYYIILLVATLLKNKPNLNAST